MIMYPRPAAQDISKIKLKIAICHPRLAWGGSEKKVLWTIEALKDSYDISLITTGEINFDELNRYYGTSIKPEEFRYLRVPLPYFLKNTNSAAGLRGAIFTRYCRRIANNYDVLISGYGPLDFGKPGIHYIADFSWSPLIRNSLHPPPSNWYHRIKLFEKIYLWISNKIEGSSKRAISSKEDLFISVSPWTAEIMRKYFGMSSKVIYTPVVGSYPKRSWFKRKKGFICLGRVSPEKRVDEIIEIVSALRDKGFDYHLHIIGDITNSTYGRYIHKLCKKYKDWAFLEGKLFEKEKIKLLTSHRYGLHACRGDAFPSAVVEMIESGCIPFVVGQGGQVDIVKKRALMFENMKDAIKKITLILNDKARQVKLRKYLENQRNRYSIDKFKSEIKMVIKEYIDDKTLKKRLLG